MVRHNMTLCAMIEAWKVGVGEARLSMTFTIFTHGNLCTNIWLILVWSTEKCHAQRIWIR